MINKEWILQQELVENHESLLEGSEVAEIGTESLSRIRSDTFRFTFSVR
jgi:hypothetical protein